MLATALTNPIDHLAGVVDMLADESIECHTTHALGDDLIGLRRQIDRLEAQFIRRLQRFDRNHGAHGENSPTTISWLRSTCGLTTKAAAERVRMAGALDELPLTAASFESGRSPYANVSMITRLGSTIGLEETRDVETTLVTAAEKLDAGRMCRLVEYTRHRLDAAGALDQENRNHERRFLAVDRTFDGVVVIHGELDTEGGAIVRTALDALSKKQGADDRRSGGQRRADALVDIASAMLRMGDLPSVHGERPHLVVTASVDALRGVAGAEPAEIQGFGFIPAETARRLACDASVRIAVELPGGAAGDRSFSIGRASRSAPAPMRTAISLRDDGCRFPGCDRPAAWTDAHHVDHWIDTGATAVPNLLSLCRFHHRVVHEQGRHVCLDPDGTVKVSQPDVRKRSRSWQRRE
ncbi:MAG: HNH endonuclease signature motif containing protein [Candidatus Dormibacteria bacterium]